VGKLLLKAMESCVKEMGGRRIEVTVDPETNHPSDYSEVWGIQTSAGKKGRRCMCSKNLAVKDYYSPGRHFILFEKLIGKDNSET